MPDDHTPTDSARYEICMPYLDPGMEEATIDLWLKQEGEFVEQGEPLYIAITLKSAVEVEAPASGHLHILVTAGSTVSPQQLLGYLIIH